MYSRGEKTEEFRAFMAPALRLLRVDGTMLHTAWSKCDRFNWKPLVKLAYVTEVAALISAHCHLLIERPEPFSTALLGDFYVQSRNRFNRWHRDLNDLENGVQIRDPLHLVGLNPIRPPLQ